MQQQQAQAEADRQAAKLREEIRAREEAAKRDHERMVLLLAQKQQKSLQNSFLVAAAEAITEAERKGDQQEVLRLQASMRAREADDLAAATACVGRGQCSKAVSEVIGGDTAAIMQEVSYCDECSMLLCGYCVQAHRTHRVLGPMQAAAVCQSDWRRDAEQR